MQESSSAAERSAVYAVFAQAFSYEGASRSPFAISGADYNEAFDLAINGKACSLREASYTQEDHSALFEELARFYEHFGLGRQQKAEMPDHLSVELEFMHFLTYLEAEHATTEEERAALRQAQADFLNRHLARLINGVQRKLKTPIPECTKMVGACQEFIKADIDFVTGFDA